MLQQTSTLLLFSVLFIFSCQQDSIKKIEIENEYGTEIYYQDADSLKQGLFSTLNKSGDTMSKAHYKNNQLQGKLSFYFENGKLKSEEHYKQDVLHGPEINYFPNGNIQTKGNFTEGVLDSMFYSYYETGELKEKITLQENTENGPFEEYYKNGVVHWKGTFIDGDNEVGLLTEYDEKGEVLKKMDCGKYKGAYICQTIWDRERGDVLPKYVYEE